MTVGRKILVAAGFTVILIGLGTADALLTTGTLRLPAAQGVVKKEGPDVEAVARSAGFTVTETTEQNLLPSNGLSARALLKNDDRAATIAWIDSPEVKSIFTTLKRNLRGKFSPDLADVIDETQSEKDKPPRDVLSFRDPAIHPDRLLFVRIRERLYEIHVSEGHEIEANGLIDALTE